MWSVKTVPNSSALSSGLVRGVWVRRIGMLMLPGSSVVVAMAIGWSLMPLQRIQPPGLSKPPTYTHVIRAGNTVYIAGQTATDEQGQVVGKGDITAQATQVFENLGKALAAVGADFSRLVKITVYLTDARFREAVTQVRSRYLGQTLPASTLVVVAGLARPDLLVEIEGIAVVD